jgi:poly-beta-1,6-N-acetyl-D-glucosamine synthase
VGEVGHHPSNCSYTLTINEPHLQREKQFRLLINGGNKFVRRTEGPLDVPILNQPRNNREHGYVLMTAAHNEEAFIERTLTSVVSQTVLPQRWVIVSDGSTDRTDQIVESYAKRHDFISFLPLSRSPGRNFGSKVLALQRGGKLLEGIGYEFIGNIDADVSLEPSYFEDLMEQFEQHRELGLLAGFVYEEKGGEFRRRSSNRVDSIPHCAQLLRRECYEDIGGYAVFRYGGEDWYAQTCAKMSGWGVEALPELRICHHRHTGAGNHILKDRFRLGRLDYSFGSDPFFEMCKCAVRLPETPFIAGAITRFAGFLWSYACRDKRPVSKEFITFLRGEQKSKLLGLYRYFDRRGTVRA